MTTVADLIAYLQKLPPDAKIEVLEEVTVEYSTYTRWVPLQLPTDEFGMKYHYTNTFDLSLHGDTVHFGAK
jgi:hypothetical protein